MKSQTFQGWYFKHITPHQVLSFIISIHQSTKETQYACIQMITKEASYIKKYNWNEIKGNKIEEGIEVGLNRFSLDGIKININFDGLSVRCELQYSNVIKLDSPIMGPFRYLKFMECSHEVYSLTHKVVGVIDINGVKDVVKDGYGYMEGDKGRSFPTSYLWTQCNNPQNAIVLAVGNVPLFGIRFEGIIGHIYYNGKHYRLATYKGAKIHRQLDGIIRVKQKQYKLVIHVLDRNEKQLQAPNNGDMKRVIRESVVCSVRYQFYIGDKKVFDFVGDTASFESDIA